MPIRLDEKGDREPAVPIVLADIRKLVNNYKKTMRVKDTCSAWVSAEEVYQLLDHNKGSSGIRLYFGRYEAESKVYPDQMNVILVATYAEGGRAPDFSNSVDMLIESELVGDVNEVSFLPSWSNYSGKGDDSIPLCPEHCPTGGTL